MSLAEAPSGPPPALEGLRADLARHKKELLRAIPAAPPAAHDAAVNETCGLTLGRKNAEGYDALLTSLVAHRRELGTFPAESVAFAAVGAYGRGALALGSDLDVRILARDMSLASAAADALLYPLWDMGVSVGHQVVTVEDLIEAARTDLPTATSLLDWRHVAGDRGLSEELHRRALASVFAHSELARFIERLNDEVAQRHARFGGSVYLLEPDVKNAAGGLRDLDVGRWAIKARYGVSGLDEMVRVGALYAREAGEIRAAAEMLWRVRNILHAHAGRRSDRLTFDEQEAIAGLLGYGEGGEAVERMMSEYYRSARTISRSLQMVLVRAAPVLTRKKPREEDLGGGVRLFDGHVTVRDAELLKSDPALAFRLVAAAVERGVPLLPFTREALSRSTSDPAFCAALRASPEAASLFIELVSARKEARLLSGSVIRELHDIGLLLAMIPEFSPVVGRVHHDIYHVYTVDVHSVAAVDRLAALARGELASEFPLACRLAAEMARPAMLFFATLLHDVGKAIGSSDHSQRGAEMAEGILRRLGFPAEDIAEACHLIRKHLLMYHVATRRDLDDPVAIAEFSREVRGREGLCDLYLLTVADLSTTSPTSMTSWKARMLDELFLATDRALGGVTSDNARRARAVEDVLREIDRLSDAAAGQREDRLAFARGFIESMPDRYLLANRPAAIAAHAELAREHESRAQLVSVALVPSSHHGAADEICVIAADRPGLLAAITAAIAASRLEVHAAQIHSRAVTAAAGGGGEPVQAVDLFWVRDRGEDVEGVARAMPKLARDLRGVLSGEIDPMELSKTRSGGSLRGRPSPRVRTQISIDNRASPGHTVIEVLTRDRPWLLFTIAETLHSLGLSIAVAKINTEGARVADVFYVSERDGTKVAPGKRSNEVEARLREAALGMENEGSGG
jgi:[protein-PII] uridylyltransferase